MGGNDVVVEPEGLGLADEVEGVFDGFVESPSYFKDWNDLENPVLPG